MLGEAEVSAIAGRHCVHETKRLCPGGQEQEQEQEGASRSWLAGWLADKLAASLAELQPATLHSDSTGRTLVEQSKR